MDLLEFVKIYLKSMDLWVVSQSIVLSDFFYYNEDFFRHTQKYSKIRQVPCGHHPTSEIKNINKASVLSSLHLALLPHFTKW